MQEKCSKLQYLTNSYGLGQKSQVQELLWEKSEKVLLKPCLSFEIAKLLATLCSKSKKINSNLNFFIRIAVNIRKKQYLCQRYRDHNDSPNCRCNSLLFRTLPKRPRKSYWE